MEEILASIRRIISEDGDAAKPAASAPAPTPAPTPAPAPAPVAAPQAVAAPAPQPAPAPVPDSSNDVLLLTEVVEDDVKPAPAPAPPPKPAVVAAPAAEPPAPSPAAASDDAIVSASVAAVATGALSNLVSAKRQTERPMSDNPMPLGNPGATLESIVRDEIRPLLRAWLDQNLPAMVERMVQREIQRISRNLE
ncbi:MAG: DUF2497 domain-containing protein [Alphaproteobacteria bacterium]|nr:DUF2497 domain-containing protein [Alphaproteobacteria bacterium]